MPGRADRARLRRRWRLYEGRGTAAVYEWDVRTARAWMNRLAPVARPAFAWNHDTVMRWGAEGLARRLGAQLLVGAQRFI